MHQLYFIGAFLQEKVRNRAFVKLDSRYADYFPEYSNLEDPWDYWSLCMEWITMEIYLLMSSHSDYLIQASFNINIRCLYIISMYHIEQKNCIILCWWLCILVYFWSSWKMVCGWSSKEIPCNLLGIWTLVHVNHNFSYEGSLHFSRSG